MPNLYTISTKNDSIDEDVSEPEKFSIVYHDIFDYPLSFPDLIKWKPGKQLPTFNYQLSITTKNGYYFLEGKEGLIYKRILRERISKKKLEIAKKASRILSFIPFIKMVAVTGSLSMGNSTDESDIDLLVVTKKGLLWTTRAFAYLFICLFGIKFRRPSDKNQKDKLCLNMWMDECDLVWKKNDRNVYSAHEIGQILPLLNKNAVYEKFLQKNRWILEFWPNSVRILGSKNRAKSQKDSSPLSLFLISLERFACWFQYQHMKSKITRETVTKTRAFFHPQDWGRVVLDRLAQV